MSRLACIIEDDPDQPRFLERMPGRWSMATAPVGSDDFSAKPVDLHSPVDRVERLTERT